MKTALLLVDHGSARGELSRLLADLARLVREFSGLEIVERAQMKRQVADAQRGSAQPKRR